MKVRQQSRRRVAWLLLTALCVSTVFPSGDVVRAVTVVQTEGTDSGEDGHVLQNPVIAAEDGKVLWDCIYFGNYWQSKYITQPENRPQQGEDDQVHTDTDGTKYLVRENKDCYKWEPIKWRVLSVSEDGTDAFLMADQNLDIQPYHNEEGQVVTWETSSIRTWLNESFLETAFSGKEQEAIQETEVENKQNLNAEEVTHTTDRIYLPSYDEITARKYGFTSVSGDEETRDVVRTDFAASGGTAKDTFPPYDFVLRTLSAQNGYNIVVKGSIDVAGYPLNYEEGIRPVLHLDLTETDLWEYAGQVKQDKKEIAPDATPIVPTPTPTAPPSVTMAPEQKYPKNPVVNMADPKKNTWDCVYFGKYYKTKITPSVLAEAGEHDTVKEDEDGNPYLIRHREGYFQYEPIKWRVLSINEDGTDAFLMADQVLAVSQYYSDADVEMTWEKSDIRAWLKTDFQEAAFTEEEQAKILESEVKTADNPWSGELGGNDTTDKLYLLSIEEAMETSYGFSSDKEESDTRRIKGTDYASAEEELDWVYSDADAYWLRSAGSEKGHPAAVGSWGDVTSSESSRKFGVRPVMHVDLSDTTMWSYAGQVTPEGVVIPVEETGDQSGTPSPEPTQKPDTTVKPPVQTVEPKTKKPGKPAIKKLKNKAGKKVTVTLSGKVSGAAGYQVAYATKSSMKGQKKKSFKGTSVTIKGLKKKKTYYFCVRAYVKENGKTVYGDWSRKKSIKVKK